MARGAFRAEAARELVDMSKRLETLASAFRALPTTEWPRYEATTLAESCALLDQAHHIVHAAALAADLDAAMERYAEHRDAREAAT